MKLMQLAQLLKSDDNCANVRMAVGSALQRSERLRRWVGAIADLATNVQEYFGWIVDETETSEPRVVRRFKTELSLVNELRGPVSQRTVCQQTGWLQTPPPPRAIVLGGGEARICYVSSLIPALTLKEEVRQAEDWAWWILLQLFSPASPHAQLLAEIQCRCRDVKGEVGRFLRSYRWVPRGGITPALRRYQLAQLMEGFPRVRALRTIPVYRYYL